MTRKIQIVSGMLAALALVAFFLLVNQRGQDAQPAGQLAQAAPADTSGFARADGPKQLQFPADHGPHPEYQTEWWYYTGNLQTEEGRRFGFQLTFFRRALVPPVLEPERRSDWATGQVYMAHFALSDIDGERFQAYERLSRGAAGLAGAQADPFQVWLGDWQVAEIPDGGACPDGIPQPCAYRLSAAQEGISLDLSLMDTKGPILQGDHGYSQKGPEPGQASYYYSLTRFKAAGKVTILGETFAVNGLSWMDHEWSTSALSQDQVGWDWFSMQFEDGTELMLFQIRRADGTIDPFSSGTLIAVDGSTTPLKWDDFTVEVTDRWTSPHSRATYPAGWIVRIPGAGMDLEIKPRMEDQELNVSYAYWEGAVQISGLRAGVPLSGDGYVELTGYSGSMGGEF